MNLIDLYIQEVTRRLPEKMRDDIEMELRSTILDMLPDEYNEEEVKEVLEKLGNPASLASDYRDQPMHLIGPRYFDAYLTLLKMMIPLAAIFALVSVFIEYLVGFDGNKEMIQLILNIMGIGIWRIIEVTFQVFFWITIIFAIVERTDKSKDSQPLTFGLNKWTPEDLKDIPYVKKEKAIPKREVFGALLWTTIWATLYFYSDHLIGIYEGGGTLNLKIPAVNQDVLFSFLPMVIMAIAFDIGFTIYKFIKGQWTRKMAVINTIHEVFVTIVFSVILLHPHLFHPEFLSYFKGFEHFDSWIISGIIITFIVCSLINIVEGFRKSK